jgi:hypothetical protein
MNKGEEFTTCICVEFHSCYSCASMIYGGSERHYQKTKGEFLGLSICSECFKR